MKVPIAEMTGVFKCSHCNQVLVDTWRSDKGSLGLFMCCPCGSTNLPVTVHRDIAGATERSAGNGAIPLNKIQKEKKTK